MKVCVTADFHWLEPPEIPECDLLILAGDCGKTPDFPEWLLAQKQPTIGIAGNHDFNEAALAALPWIYLHDSAVGIGGREPLKVWGSPWTPRFLDWAWMKDDADLAEVYAQIPDDVDIIISHGPPHGYGDLVETRGSPNLGEHVGSKALLKRARQLDKLKLLACGHIHEGYGSYNVPSFGAPGGVSSRDIRFRVVNGSWVDSSYAPGNPPIVVDL